MNDEFKDLENELRLMEPSEPSEALRDRVFGVFAGETEAVPEASAKPDNIITWFRPIGAAAAVALVFMGAIWMLKPGGGDGEERPSIAETQPAAPVERPFQPVKVGRIYSDPRDEGIVINDEGQPVRRVRLEIEDAYQWERASDGKRILLRVPHEEGTYFHFPVETD